MNKYILLILLILIFPACQTAHKENIMLASVHKPFKYEIPKETKLDKGALWLRRSLNTKNYGYQRVKDPTGSSPFPIVERFEVRPGDCESDGYWSDCATDRERSELSEYVHRSGIGQTWWYQWYLYVPLGYPNIYPTKTALGQFHQVNGTPVFMFQNHKGGLYLDDQQRERYYKLIDKDDFRGRWHKFTLNVHWTKNGDGFFKVWVNDELKAEINRSTMNKDYTYLKYGIYRSYISRYKNAAGVKDVPGQIVYYAGVKKAKTREKLDVIK